MKNDYVIDKTFVSSMMEFDIDLVGLHNLNMFSTIRLISPRLNMSYCGIQMQMGYGKLNKIKDLSLLNIFEGHLGT